MNAEKVIGGVFIAVVSVAGTAALTYLAWRLFQHELGAYHHPAAICNGKRMSPGDTCTFYTAGTDPNIPGNSTVHDYNDMVSGAALRSIALISMSRYRGVSCMT